MEIRKMKIPMERFPDSGHGNRQNKNFHGHGRKKHTTIRMVEVKDETVWLS